MIMRYRFACSAIVATLLATTAAAATIPNPQAQPQGWNHASAAHYLDSRQTWWMSWPRAQRDHETACVSCHTVLPYAMGRPSLRQSLGETGPSAPEQQMLGYIIKRVNLWNEVKPFYSDEDVAPKKTRESRGTEAIMNALVLARYDARQGHLNDITRKAFDNMWATQLVVPAPAQTQPQPAVAYGAAPSSPPAAAVPSNTPADDETGSWDWINFQNAPWESNESHYYGATLAAIAVGLAPEDYKDSPAIQPRLHLLTEYLLRDYDTQPLVNRIVILWASSQIPALLPPAKRNALLEDIRTHQQADGGWTLTSLGAWKRHDDTPLDQRSDGYATGLTVYALKQAGVATDTPEMKQAIAWLLANQDSKQGLWPAYSLNKQRDLSSDIGRFMSDAATSYSAMALESVQR
jgi:squalene-hopene/tetraprenyl-beta-curcumene cyclase